MKSHCVFFAEPDDKVVELPKSREIRQQERKTFDRRFAFWSLVVYIALICVALAWMSTKGGQ
jgi:predicted nucleic acid-binding Zn ribbon protein